MSAPLLSLVMMVKNEEAFLEDALRSALPLCDELVVVDTGSTDRTVEIARDLGARVSSFAWCDDFSAARNETLRQARGQWVAVLDADERFRCADPAAVRALLAPGPDFPCEGLSLPVVNVTLEGQVISRFQSVRIFGNAPDRIAYVGRVHNQLRSLDPTRPRIQARVCPALEVVHSREALLDQMGRGLLAADAAGAKQGKGLGLALCNQGPQHLLHPGREGAEAGGARIQGPLEAAHRHLVAVAGVDHQGAWVIDQGIPVGGSHVGAHGLGGIHAGPADRHDFGLEAHLEPMEGLLWGGVALHG